jgi:hypothetical protein
MTLRACRLSCILKSRMRAHASAAVGAVLVSACIAATPAAGHVPVPTGVHVDPGSPAGKQYQIPIPAARQETSGSSGSGSSANGNPPLFGVGITSPASGSTAGGSASGRTQARSGRRSAARSVRTATRSTSRRTPRPSAASSLAASDRTTQAGTSSWVPLVAGGGLVLVLGGGGGLGLRRRYVRT